MLKKFNLYLANILANALSSMLMFYIICFLVFSILFFQMPKTPLEWIAFIVQTFFQGVALPILAFVSKVESEKTNKIIEDIYSGTLSQIHEITEIQSEVTNLIIEQKKEMNIELEQNELLKNVIHVLEDEQEGSED